MNSAAETDPAFPGTMMDEPLLLKNVIERIEAIFGDQRLTCYTDAGVQEMTYRQLADRVRRLASSLVGLGVRPGDRVATFAWNTHEHLELCLAVPAIGAVIHPLNTRLHPDDLAHVIDHAGDRFIAVEQSLADRLPHLNDAITTIVIADADSESCGRGADYEGLVSSGDRTFQFPLIPETAGCTLCYTSGTTGKPKGVVYTHRSTILHLLVESLPDFYAISEADVVFPVVPIFHANAWGLPYATLMAGGRLVLGGSLTAPAAVAQVLSEQRVTFTGGVPTIWHGLVELTELPDLTSLRMIVCGGAALPMSLLARYDELGLPLVQGYGMTETSPFLSVGRVPSRYPKGGPEAESLRLAQGSPVPLVDMRVDPGSGNELQLRGATIVASYYDAPAESEEKFTEDGWLRTGDIAEKRTDGVIRIVDRAKDMIKSGGEWIPSAELENAILSHPAIAEAAVVAISDDRWGERPAAFIVARTASLDADMVREHLTHHVAKWWIPETIRFQSSLPRTTLGKIDKKILRTQALPLT